ncbi:carbohydrate porin [Sphingomonas glacialis]|uniref:carbohydrate porin n=1 Tax=Sphingomonas glacialis TaxID=658225 RepID=UPI001F4F1ABB|nr:carbohydrate porin [Sphingomonas glacialis]
MKIAYKPLIFWYFIAAIGGWTGPALAQSPAAETTPPPRAITLDGRYVFDVIDVAAGGDKRGAGVLGNLELTAEGDLGRLVGWRGARVHVHLLSNHGRAMNDFAGTLQGIDNIEVADGRTKLYEAWIEQGFANDRLSLLVGLSDLNADFYQNDAAGLLIAPAFGIGSEFAATGPNGPSIFPSTALTARLNIAVTPSAYLRAAVVDARAGVLGDDDGVDLTMQEGALLIAEGGSTRGGGKLALGLWQYTRRQDDLYAVDLTGAPIRRIARGAYVLLDQRLSGSDARGLSMFVRAGVSDSATTPFRGGFQAGLLANGIIRGRPDGQLSIGVAHALLSSGMKAQLRDAGDRPGAGETGLELTYQDRVAPFLSVQPDVQYIRRAHGSGTARGTLVFGLRIIAAFARR